jgi:hypothetical protein
MQDEQITPVNHSTFSAAASTATSAAGHGLKSGASAAFKWIVAFAIAGAVIGLLGSTVGFGFLSMGAGGSAIGHVLSSTLIGGLVAGAVGAATSMFPAVLGGAWGAGKGAVEGHHRVSQERGAAAEMNAQLSALQAQAAMQSPQTNIYTAPAQENILNPQGSRTNAALSGIDAGSVAYDGKMASQLQAARA